MLSTSNDVIVRICEVLFIDDEYGGNRIKVRIGKEDSNTELSDLPYCTPLLPGVIHIVPKVGETVLVILERQSDAWGNRFYIGPLFSQEYFQDYSPHYFSSRALLNGKQPVRPLPHPKMNVDNYGTFPNNDDVCIYGRGNSEIKLKENEVIIRSGYKSSNKYSKVEDKLTYNDKDYGFISVRYKTYLNEKKKERVESMVNIVADKINLLSHKSKTYFDTLDRDELITDEVMGKIMADGHPLILGDVLINFLKNLLRIVREHVHPFPGLPPALAPSDVEVLSTDLDKFLSEHIKIN